MLGHVQLDLDKGMNAAARAPMAPQRETAMPAQPLAELLKRLYAGVHSGDKPLAVAIERELHALPLRES